MEKVTMKVCILCKEEKSVDSFYIHTAGTGVRRGSCKECDKQKSKERNKKISSSKELLFKERKRGRDKYFRLKEVYQSKKPSLESMRIRRAKYKEMYPEKYLAVLKSKTVKPLNKGYHKHHWSYNEEHYRDIIELPQRNHLFLHRFIRYDQERMMYRGLDGILLDTKEAHIKYFEECLIKHEY